MEEITFETFMNWLDGFFVQSAVEGILAILLVLIVTLFCWKIAKKIIRKHLVNKNLEIILNITKIVIWTFGILIATRQIKALQDLALVLFSSSGVVVVVLGLSAQETMNNIISGVMIAWNKPFEIGDYIRCVDNNAEGYVHAIELRHTILRTFENHLFVVPNSILNTSVIENYTMAEKQCIFFDVGISYESDLERAIEIIRDIALAHPLFYDVRTKEDIENGVEPVTVRVQALADFSVKLRAVLWVECFNQRGSYLSDLRKAVKLQFDKEGIEIPYPYQNTIIHTKEK
ncbi:MAG: mechanosensitive ion channel family protein [Erysipelotrichaceae bacterium]|nr:mechanosensitive ion channel family protein [Erysipelotrichaceae bacterium]